MTPAREPSLTDPAEPHRRNGTAPGEALAPIGAIDFTADDNAALTAVAQAVSSLPRPPLSPAFRAQLHGELVRLEARLAAERSRQPFGLAWLGHIGRSAGPADPSNPADTSTLRVHRWPAAALRWPAAAIGVPVAIALAMTVLIAAGLAYAAERSRPGDVLWPVHAALTRWRTGDAPARPDSAVPNGDAPADPIGGAASSAPSATVVGRTERRPTATPGQAPKPTARVDALPPVVVPATDFNIDPDASGAVLMPPTTYPDGPDPDAQMSPPASASPVEPPESRDPGGPGEPGEPAEPPETVPPHEPPAAPDDPQPRATPAPDPLADPDVATLTGTVRLRDGAAMAPLAGVVVSLARVADVFPSGCDPVTLPPENRVATTDAEGQWSAQVPAGRWVVAVTGGCLGPSRQYLADFNGAVATDACSALTLPVAAGGVAPSAVVVIPLDVALGCGPLPTAIPSP